MSRICLLHRPGADRDALLTFLHRQGHEVRLEDRVEDLARAVASGSPPPLAVVQQSALGSRGSLSVLSGHPTLLLGGEEAPEGTFATLPEPYFFTDLQAALEDLALRGPPAGPAAPARPPATGDALSPVLRGVAHALNNPLTGALGWVQILAADLSEDDARRRTLEQVRRELGHIEQIAFALGVIGRRPGGLEGDLDLRGLLERHLDVLRAEGMPLTYSAPPHTCPRVRGDPREFGLMLDLLFTSLLEERSRVAALKVSLTPGPEHLDLAVRIEGLPLPDDVHPSDLGLLLRNTRPTRALGLAIADTILSARPGGAVEVESGPGDVGSMLLRIPTMEPGGERLR